MSFGMRRRRVHKVHKVYKVNGPLRGALSTATRVAESRDLKSWNHEIGGFEWENLKSKIINLKLARWI